MTLCIRLFYKPDSQYTLQSRAAFTDETCRCAYVCGLSCTTDEVEGARLQAGLAVSTLLKQALLSHSASRTAADRCAEDGEDASELAATAALSLQVRHFLTAAHTTHVSIRSNMTNGSCAPAL